MIRATIYNHTIKVCRTEITYCGLKGKDKGGEEKEREREEERERER